MNPRPVSVAVTLALCGLVVVGHASAAAPDFPVAVDRAPSSAPASGVASTAARLGVASTPVTAPTAEASLPSADVTVADGEPSVVDDATGPLAVADIAAPPRVDAPVPATGGGAAVGILDSGRTLTLYASNDAFRAEYESDADRLGFDGGRLSGGFLLSEERDNVFTGTVMLDTFPGLVPNVRLSFGTRAYVALLGIENLDVFGLGIGLQAYYDLPVQAFPLQLGAEFYYTPDVLTFGQADSIVDLNVDIGLAVRDNISAFVGFRFLQFDTRPGDREVEDDVHIGVRWAFGDASDDVVAVATPATTTPRFR